MAATNSINVPSIGVVFLNTSSTPPKFEPVAPGNSGTVLTSTGTTSAPTFQAAGGGSGFTSINVQTFTSDGTYTPTTGMAYCIVEAMGGGGGGGGCDSTNGGNEIAAAAGGANGAYVRGVFSAAQIGVSKAVTIGAGGAGGSGNNTGSTGQSTVLDTLITAVGAAGGQGSAAEPLTSSVGPGECATGSSGGYLQTPGSPGSVSYATAVFGFSGSGGSGIFGSGGTSLSLHVTSASNGNAGRGYGSGGGGALNTGVVGSKTGGAGANGVLVVTEFIV